jgi:GNAT superfamily N-acetyltransferase
MLRDFLDQSDAWCYRVGWPSGEGFGIGTVLNPQTIKRYSAAQLTECAIGDYHLTWRAVDPDAQNRGVGTAIMSSRVAHARELRCKARDRRYRLAQLGNTPSVHEAGFYGARFDPTPS